MKFSQLLLYVLLVIIGFWILGIALSIAKWLIEIALFVTFVLVIVYLVNRFYESHKNKKQR
ncbi:MAG: hypothetical protein WBP26_03445 [Candidatus Saccharimonadales bacterium]